MKIPKLTLTYECECGCKMEFEAIQQATINCNCGKQYDVVVGLYETKRETVSTRDWFDINDQ